MTEVNKYLLFLEVPPRITYVYIALFLFFFFYA